MSIIDRYLLWTFWRVFLICFISLAGLYVVIDAFSHLDELVRYGETHGGLLPVVASYYGPRLLSFFDVSSGVLTLIAAVFTVTWLQNTNEMTALLAAGIPKRRIVAPLLVAAVIAAGLSALNREIAIPRLREALSTDLQDPEGTRGRGVIPRYDNQSDILLRARECFPEEQRIARPNFRLPPTLFRFGRQLVAADAIYREGSADHPAGYLLREVEEVDLTQAPSAWREEQPILLTPHDTPWLEADQCFVVSQVSFELLSASNQWRDLSSTAELVVALKNPALDLGPDVRVAVHTRILRPLLDLTLLLLGLPLVLGREQRNVFVAVGLCILVVGVFLGSTLASQSLGNQLLLPASLAAWLPLLIFAPAAGWMSEPLRSG